MQKCAHSAEHLSDIFAGRWQERHQVFSTHLNALNLIENNLILTVIKFDATDDSCISSCAHILQIRFFECPLSCRSFASRISNKRLEVALSPSSHSCLRIDEAINPIDKCADFKISNIDVRLRIHSVCLSMGMSL